MTLQRILLIAAIAFAVIFTLFGFEIIDGQYALGWLGLAVGCGLASRL